MHLDCAACGELLLRQEWTRRQGPPHSQRTVNFRTTATDTANLCNFAAPFCDSLTSLYRRLLASQVMARSTCLALVACAGLAAVRATGITMALTNAGVQDLASVAKDIIAEKFGTLTVAGESGARGAARCTAQAPRAARFLGPSCPLCGAPARHRRVIYFVHSLNSLHFMLAC